jgi:alanine dehydrogenase
VIIGIPKEIKTFEFRVAMTVDGVKRLVQTGHTVFIENGAGIGAGFKDADYRRAGAKILTSKREIYKKSDLIIKVKEPQPSEYSLLRSGLILFTFLHLAANRTLLRELLRKKVTAIAYETIQTEEGRLPLLAPMSEIAGKLTPLIGANYLRKDLGGKGTLLSSVGLGGTGHVTVIGAGQVGSQAVMISHALGAALSVYDINREKLERLNGRYGERLQILSDEKDLPEILKRTDLLIGAVLVPGKRAPSVVTRKMVKLMEPGSVIVDVAVDQGGCVETIRPTTLKNPVYKKYGILHYGVANIPSLVPRTATEALSLVTLPYIWKLAEQGVEKALASDPGFRKGLNTMGGETMHPALTI